MQNIITKCKTEVSSLIKVLNKHLEKTDTKSYRSVCDSILRFVDIYIKYLKYEDKMESRLEFIDQTKRDIKMEMEVLIERIELGKPNISVYQSLLESFEKLIDVHSRLNGEILAITRFFESQEGVKSR